MHTAEWEFWIDVGGTFTDCLARRPDGTLARHKILSSGVTKGQIAAGSDQRTIFDAARLADPSQFWRDYIWRWVADDGRPLAESRVHAFAAEAGRLELASPLAQAPTVGARYELHSDEDAPLVGMRYLAGVGRSDPLPRCRVRLGTTRGTNALLTRRGARTALVTTRGFADLLRIGYQNRPKLFALDIIKPEPLFDRVVEIDERITAAGEVLRPADEAEITRVLTELRATGIESLAVCLLHAHRNGAHEQWVGQRARELGFAEVSLSSAVAAVAKMVPRGETTVLDAYLNPVLRSYVARLRQALGDNELRIMTSAGGLVDGRAFCGKDSILSGPAGGVVGFSRVAQGAGFSRSLGFDMGGTSTDVSRFDGQFELEFETEKAGVRVAAPVLAIETVAAGGGSICRFDGIKLVVGPDSAGADPGPACYGRGGPLTITDVNLYLGRMVPDRFPFPLDVSAVRRRVEELQAEVTSASGQSPSAEALCAGWVQIANACMAQAIRSISLGKGYNPAEYVLVAFGGAAPQHACTVARELGCRQVLIHPDAGLLSAYGIGQAELVRHRAKVVDRPLSADELSAVEVSFAALEREAIAELAREGLSREQIRTEQSLDLRYQGMDACLTVPAPSDGDYTAAFEVMHRRLHGYVHIGRRLQVVAARVAAIGGARRPVTLHGAIVPRTLTARRRQAVWCDGQSIEAAVWLREELTAGATFSGPALVCEASSTVWIEPQWTAAVLAEGELLLTDDGGAAGEGDSAAVARAARRTSAVRPGLDSDPVWLEVFHRQFAAIAEQMGITLRNTASSVNVKERLDFSCALFTAQGDLVVNAPHIPVHLGAMSQTVRQVLADNPDLVPGDVFVTNDPYRGGSHLPDVTVVTPVHDAASGRLVLFSACRAHHAEMGGVRPGSMPPFSSNLAEEGVLIRNFRLLAAGESRFEALGNLLRSGRWPSRQVEDNLADLAAQVAANRQGALAMGRVIERYGLAVVLAYMGHIQQAAAEKTRRALAQLAAGTYRFADQMDDGTPVAVSITVRDGSAEFDFSGTGPVSAGNLNANPAIVTAAVLYVLRLLLDEDIPLNQGVLDPVRIIVPPGLLNPPAGATPEACSAVVGGNVETSQRVVDVLLGALNLAAASQGTMNNLTFGDESFGYYETICGGAGATRRRPGADAVHTHMTNTRLTDPEVLEQRFPVRLWEFSIRRGSGGCGKHRGGDGIVRRIEFLKRLDVSILSERRGENRPFGLAGGEPGAAGRQTLVRSDGSRQELRGKVQLVVEPGDVLVLETPGGGGWGAPA